MNPVKNIRFQLFLPEGNTCLGDKGRGEDDNEDPRSTWVGQGQKGNSCSLRVEEGLRMASRLFIGYPHPGQGSFLI